MNRRYFMLGMAGMAAPPDAVRPKKPRLNVYNWSATSGAGHDFQFRSRVWCGRALRTYESNEEMLAKVITGNSGWDIVFPTYTRLKPMPDYGLLQPLKHEWLPGLKNLDPRFRTPVWDQDLQWNRHTCGLERALPKYAILSRRPPAGQICGTPGSKAV